MTDIEKICDVLGRKVIASSVGVGSTAISNALENGKFPSRWYLVILALCEQSGVDCPLDAFSFARPVTLFRDNSSNELLSSQGNEVSDV